MTEKINWNNYFMAMAFLTAQRSIDPSTKCGCVIVSSDNRILSTGYNGPIKNSDDKKIPLTRPEKYKFIIHSEINALLSYNGSYNDIQGAKCYVTIRPCHDCLRSLIQKGIKTIYYSTLQNAACVDKDSITAQDQMIKDHDIKLYQIQIDDIASTLDKTKQYINNKLKENV